MGERDTIQGCLRELSRHASCYGLALHIRRGRPAIVRSTYPDAWRRIYGERHFALCDPVLVWGVRNEGIIRLDSSGLHDPCGVIPSLHAMGLRFGIAVATGDAKSRSLGSLVRADRMITDGEAQQALSLLRRMHAIARQSSEVLTPAQIEALQRVSLGERHAAAAYAIGITESALKARLKAARENIGAQTTAEAVRMAQIYGLLR